MKGTSLLDLQRTLNPGFNAAAPVWIHIDEANERVAELERTLADTVDTFEWLGRACQVMRRADLAERCERVSTAIRAAIPNSFTAQRSGDDHG